MKFIIGLIVGLTLGTAITLASNHFVEASYVPEYNFKDLMLLSSVKIKEDNFQCESQMEKSVGDVLGAIYRANSNRYLNRVNESCSGNICQITYNSCRPWQSDSCGSTSLFFEVTDNGKIDPLSFKCLQIP